MGDFGNRDASMHPLTSRPVLPPRALGAKEPPTDRVFSDAGFRADPAERLIGPDARPRASLLSVAFALFAASALHILVLALIVYERSWEADPAQQETEIPVEIVVEPPPRPPKPPEPEQKKPEPPLPPEYEKPATDAPRAATNENVDRDGPVKPEAAPKPQATPASAPPAPATEQGPQRDGASEASKLTAEPTPDKLDAETLPLHDSTPDKSAEEQVRAENKIEQPTPRRPAAKSQQFPTFAALPEIDFGGAAKQTPIAGGNAKSTYLSVLYAMIVQHLRKPPGGRGNASARGGTIEFIVDALGNLSYRRIGRSSGLPNLDEAALDAVGKASPFPPPPQGHRVGITFTFGAN
jgi:TonB family protein